MDGSTRQTVRFLCTGRELVWSGRFSLVSRIIISYTIAIEEPPRGIFFEFGSLILPDSSHNGTIFGKPS